MTAGACSRQHGGRPPRIVAASSGRALDTKQSVAVERHHKLGGWPSEGEDWPCFAPRCVPPVNMGAKGGSVHHPVAAVLTMPTRPIEQGSGSFTNGEGRKQNCLRGLAASSRKEAAGVWAPACGSSKAVPGIAALNVRYGNKNRSLRPIRARYCLCPGHRAQPMTFATTIERHSHELAR